MALINYIDPVARRIHLSAETVNATINPIDLYKEVRTLRRVDETLRPYDPFIKAYGHVAKGGGKYTERYTVLQDCLITPYPISHVLTIVGTLIDNNGFEGVYCFDKASLPEGVSVDISYIPPQVEIIEVTTASITGGLTTEEHNKLMGLDTSNLDVPISSRAAIGDIPTKEDIADAVWNYEI